MFRSEIIKGIDFLMSVQNQDGGIPGIKSVDESACWTTAEALESVLLSPYLRMNYHNFVFKMIEFLLNTQVEDPNHADRDGGWPEYVSSNVTQSMTTGHALAALRLAKDIIVDDNAMTLRISNAISKGFAYLNATQHPDGSWGVEPESGGSANESRPFCTIFVLRGYIQNGYDYQHSKIVRSGCEYLKTLRDTKTAGYMIYPNSAPDICYTSRIVSTLVKAKAYLPSDKFIKDSLKFIFEDKKLKELFKIRHESYVASTNSGMVIFHRNTPIDVMEALSVCHIYDRRVKAIEKWITDTQEPNGGWYLGGTHDPVINEGVITWTTNEGIFALICADNTFHTKREVTNEKKLKIAYKVIFTLCIIIFLLFIVYSTPVKTTFNTYIWSKIPSAVQKFMVLTVFVGLALNLFASAIYDFFKKFFSNRGD